MYKLNDSVIVNDPSHKDSSHNNGFNGVVIGVGGTGVYLIRDQDESVFQVSHFDIEGLDTEE